MLLFIVFIGSICGYGIARFSQRRALAFKALHPEIMQPTNYWPLGLQSPLVCSIWLASLFTLIYLRHGLNFSGVYLGGLSLFLTLMALEDLKHHHVYDRDQAALLLWTLMSLAFITEPGIPARLIGAGLLGFPLLMIHIWRPDGLGMGDVIFIANCGLALGYAAGTRAFLLGITAALLHHLFLLLRKNAHLKTALPLIPYIAVGIWVTCLLWPKFFST